MDYQEILHFNTMMKLANSRSEKEELITTDQTTEKDEEIEDLKETIHYQKQIIVMIFVLFLFNLLAVAVCQ